MSGQARFVAYDAVQYPVEFDAYVASSRGEIVGSAVKSKKEVIPTIISIRMPLFM